VLELRDFYDDSIEKIKSLKSLLIFVLLMRKDDGANENIPIYPMRFQDKCPE